MMELALQPDERILAKTRKHWLVFLRDVAGTIVLGVAPFVLIALVSFSGLLDLTNTLFMTTLGFAEVLWLLLVWMALVAIWTNYYLDLWVVTNRRVVNIDQSNFFNRATTTWQFENIQEITTEKKNLIQTLFNYGFINIRTASPTERHARMEGIPRPDDMCSLMLKQTETHPNF